MTKKHFDAFAREIKAWVGELRFQDAALACRIVIRIASEDNPRFDRARFIKACGLEGVIT